MAQEYTKREQLNYLIAKREFLEDQGKLLTLKQTEKLVRLKQELKHTGDERTQKDIN